MLRLDKNNCFEYVQNYLDVHNSYTSHTNVYIHIHIRVHTSKQKHIAIHTCSHNLRCCNFLYTALIYVKTYFTHVYKIDCNVSITYIVHDT